MVVTLCSRIWKNFHLWVQTQRFIMRKNSFEGFKSDLYLKSGIINRVLLRICVKGPQCFNLTSFMKTLRKSSFNWLFGSVPVFLSLQSLIQTTGKIRIFSVWVLLICHYYFCSRLYSQNRFFFFPLANGKQTFDADTVILTRLPQ